MEQKGMSFRQAWLWQALDGTASLSAPEAKHLLTRESLLDALLILFEECCQHQRTEHIRKFVDIYQEAINEVRAARVLRSDFQPVALVGRGQFGKVELVRVREGPSDSVYALKTIPKKIASDSVMSMSVWEERDLLTRANSPWLIQAHYAFQDDANLYLVMDFLPGGDLLSLMHRQEDIFTEENVRFYFAEILLAVNAVHHIGYVHRDIKPENVLLDQRGHLKLVDFGSAVKIGSVGRSVGTKSYMSPEALEAVGPDHSFRFGPKLDFWSLGIMLYEMLYFRNPFEPEEDTAAIEVIRNVLNWRNSLVFDEEIFQISADCRSLIQQLITSVDCRFDFDQITQHPFMAHVAMSQLNEMTPPFIPKLSGDDDVSNFEPPPPNPAELREGRSSFANGDCLSQVLFLGFAHSTQARARKPRARTSLATEALPSATLERKMAERASELKDRCRELEECRTRLESDLCLVEKQLAARCKEAQMEEEKKDKGSEKSEKACNLQQQSVRLDTGGIKSSEESYTTTSKLRNENAKLQRLVAGLNVELEEQRQRAAQFREASGRSQEAEQRWRERARDLETRLRSAARRKSAQHRRIDEALTEEHRAMLNTIQEQADMIVGLESSRQSMLQELQDSVLRNETLQEELRSCGRPKASRTRSSVPAPPAPDFDQPGTPTASFLPPSDQHVTSTPSEPPQTDRERALGELSKRVAELVAEVAAARQEQRQMEARWSAKEDELRAAIEERDHRLSEAAEERKVLQQKYERMCVEKIDKYDENRVLKKERTALLEKEHQLRQRIEEAEAASTAAEAKLLETQTRTGLLDRQLAELQDRCDQLQAEAREVQELRTRISRVEKEASQSEDDLRARLEAVQRDSERAQAEAHERKIALSEVNALLASSRQREKLQREAAEASARRAEQLQGEASGAAQQQSKALQELRTKFLQVSEALEDTERHLQEAQRDREAAATRASSLAASADIFQSRCVGLEHEVQRLRVELSVQEERRGELERRLSSVTSQVGAERAAAAEKSAAASEEAARRLTEARERLKAEGGEWKARCDDLDAKLAQRNIEVSQLSRDKQSVTERLEVISKRAKFAEDEAKRLKEECAAHITSVQHLRRENLDLQRELDAAEDSYDALSHEKAQLEAQLKAKEHEFSVERFRATSTIQQQAKLIDMLKGNVENAGGKRKGIKQLFASNSRSALSAVNPSTPSSCGRQGNSTPRP